MKRPSRGMPASLTASIREWSACTRAVGRALRTVLSVYTCTDREQGPRLWGVALSQLPPLTSRPELFRKTLPVFAIDTIPTATVWSAVLSRRTAGVQGADRSIYGALVFLCVSIPSFRHFIYSVYTLCCCWCPINLSCSSGCTRKECGESDIVYCSVLCWHCYVFCVCVIRKCLWRLHAGQSLTFRETLA